MSGHLTDEQLAALLADEPVEPEAQAHLETCAPCRNEVHAVRSATGDFNELTLAWAQGQAPLRVQPPSRVALLLGGRPMWGMGLATALAAGVVAFSLGLPGMHVAGMHAAGARTAQTSVAEPAHAELANAELAQDNRLMESIDEELRYSEQPAVPVRELRAATRHGQHQLSATLEN